MAITKTLGSLSSRGTGEFINKKSGPLYVDDVFSTYLYSGNSSIQVITNGIDLAGKGGLVWRKIRDQSDHHRLSDTLNGIGRTHFTNLTNAMGTGDDEIKSFNSDGFTMGNAAGNSSGATYTSWTFRKAPKFFDIQSINHTNGTANNIDLSVLGTVGMVIAKITTTMTNGDWCVWHKDLTVGNNLVINTTAAQSTTNAYLSVSGTTATLSASAPTATYVIYAWAHDTTSTGMIQCGSYIANGTNKNITLGWEPQYVMVKRATNTSDWWILDSMLGWSLSTDNALHPNTTGALDSGNTEGNPTSTGFYIEGAGNLGVAYGGSNQTMIYMAIRRPNKPPTSGTQVYSPLTRTGTGSAASITGIGFPPDLTIAKCRDFVSGASFATRMQGPGIYLDPNQSSAEWTGKDNIISWGQNGISVGADTFDYSYNHSALSLIINFFRRAPGFMDVVCYTGTGAALNINHNLSAAPELVICKIRNTTGNWFVFSDFTSTTHNNGYLNQTNAFGFGNTYDVSMYFSSRPSSSVIPLTNYAGFNNSASTYIMYLFATLAGISKVGKYTGNGSSQTIACGFASGARFVMIKCTSTTGDWYIWDTARGIVSANDPHLSINSTPVEVTTDDSIDPDSTGFIVNQVAATNINVSSATYLYLAIA